MYPIPILSPFLFIPLLHASFSNSQYFKFTCLHSFLYTTTYISVKGGKPPLTINNREKYLLPLLKWCNMHAYQIPSQCALQLASLRSEEVNAWGHLQLFKQYVVVMQTMSYAFVPSFISMSTTVSKFEKWRVPEDISCRSNNIWSSWKNEVIMGMM